MSDFFSLVQKLNAISDNQEVDVTPSEETVAKRKDIAETSALLNKFNEIQDANPYTPVVAEAQEDEVEEPIVVTTPNNAQIGKPLKWFRAQPPNSKIKNEAEDQYRLRLLDLYISHINETGETYFPRLEQMLRANAEFYGY